MSRRALSKLRKMIKDEKQRLLITLELLAEGRFQELGLDHPCKIVAALAALHDQLVRLVENGSNVSSSQDLADYGSSQPSEEQGADGGMGGRGDLPGNEIENVNTYRMPIVETWDDVYVLVNAALGARRVPRLPLSILVRYGVNRLRDLYLAGLIDRKDYVITLMLYDTMRIS